ncbi:Thioesterase/thiol ester dehydrase-isomerase [Ascobolus immersus RN42]|uniref:Thioesterase/thiol ester dehydrase-isomerase n=1 Tax=Ascobolus immersus RN42 TaxID=1160509 RepID=A0A3N4ISH5_ASCIM|nr:Thioesterase/thiol ester dehydrase-isomerase [Ascobolus immersus RN42]
MAANIFRTRLLAAPLAFLGTTASTYYFLSPFTYLPAYLPVPTEEKLTANASSLPLVQKLRSDPTLTELPSSQFGAVLPPSSYTSSVISGGAGLGYNRVWVRQTDDLTTGAKKGDATSLVWLGRDLAGFPGVVHGGVLATVLDEAMGRQAMGCLGGKAVTGGLELRYRSKTWTRQFVVVRTGVVKAEGRKAVIKGRVESLDGTLLVEADGTFVIPRSWKLE